MQTPDFWHPGKGGLLAELLSPLGWVYGFTTRTKIATTTPWASPVPILCVGNLIAGGAGKTPVAMDLGQRLAAQGKAVHFLSRGYGGTEKGPLSVDPDRHSFHQVGDEPLLLAASAPTWVSKDRKPGCLAAASAGADLIIMDDGFQNPYIRKDMSIVVIDGGFGFGNGKLIPAGPLRETVADGLARASAVVIMGEDTTSTVETVSRYAHTPLRAHLVPDDLPAEIKTTPFVAFAGIGRPAKFFDTVAALGCSVVSNIAFPDHHPYNEADMKKLLDTAQKANARLLTTQKDACRLPADFKEKVVVLPVRLAWDDEGALDRWLAGVGDV